MFKRRHESWEETIRLGMGRKKMRNAMAERTLPCVQGVKEASMELKQTSATEAPVRLTAQWRMV